MPTKGDFRMGAHKVQSPVITGPTLKDFPVLGYSVAHRYLSAGLHLHMTVAFVCMCVFACVCVVHTKTLFCV